ncbi:Mu transposase C-terminal domain-containing protein [Arthrobacter sp. MW3 TE3886]|uniref:Mu transposase C-terminal domain-containing protein n=1 Tax=Arthrobacter sp. MW3 TE3886 TaxID=3156254 RepID=UPI003513394C
MDSIQLGEILKFEDGDYILETVHGATLGLRHTLTAERMSVHVSALPALLVTPPKFTIEDPGPRALEWADSKDSARAVMLAAHLEEMMHGTPLKGMERRRQYDPERTTQTQRIDSKVLELAGLGVKCSRRTLSRWSSDYRERGIESLTDKRQERRQEPLGRLDERVKGVLIGAIANETNRSTGSVDRLIRSVKAELIRLYPGEDIHIPSDRTFRRQINSLTRGKYTTGNAPNRRSAANAPDRMFSSRPAIAPGHEVQTDTSPFDVTVVTGIDPESGKIKTGRANLVIMLDKATQSIIATSVRLQGVKGIDLAFMLAQCLTPRQLRPEGIVAFNEYELAEMPWAKFLSAEEASKFETTRPFIKPQRIMKDNGSDYASVVFESACSRFGIDTTSAAIHTPTDKPNVERAFHTIKTKFAQYLPGYTGGSTDKRGEHPEKDDLLDVYTLAELFERWVAIVWQNMRHESLRDPLVPSIVHSPNSMYMAMFPMTGYVPLPLSADDYIALLPTELRTIQMDGIQIDYRRYDARELHPYRLQDSPDAARGGKWTVHFNPHDPSAVWIRDPEESGWIQCDWMNRDAFARPFSASVRRDAREITAAQGVLGDEASTQAAIELIGHTAAARKRHVMKLARQESARNLATLSGAKLPLPAVLPVVQVAEAQDVDDEEEYDEIEMFDPMKGWTD